MFDRSELRQAWNRAHQEKPTPARPQEEIITFAEWLRQRLPPGSPVLDAGCGRGRNTVYLSQVGFAVYGCDLSVVALGKARARVEQANVAASFQTADLTRLPYSDCRFEAAVCVRVLPYHFKVSIMRAVRELWRVLRPGGRLYVDLLDCDDAEYGCGRELEPHTFLDPDGVPIHFSSRGEIDELLRGFAVERLDRFELGPRPRVGWTIWATRCKRSES